MSLPGASELNLHIEKGGPFRLIKDDVYTTVGILTGDEFGHSAGILVKRFNYRGLADLVVQKALGSRAKRLWKATTRLFKRGLPVPEPLTFIEPTFSQKSSFFLSAAIANAENLADIYLARSFQREELIAGELARAVASWHLAGAGHGDLKWSNILVEKAGEGYNFYFIDLDRSELGTAPSPGMIRKDLTRFYRYGLELNAGEWVKSLFFPKYLSIIPDHLRSEIPLTDITKRAYSEWVRKGRKTAAAASR